MRTTIRLPLIAWSLMAYAAVMPVMFVIETWRYGVRPAARNFCENSLEWWHWARTGQVP